MIVVAGAALAVLFAVVCLAPPRARAWIWIAVIVAGVVPWLDFQAHSHWRRVGWVPFLSPPVRIRDIVLNAAMYLPFGVFFHGSHVRRLAHCAVVVTAAFALSVATEASQSYSHSRFPSATDVAANTTGAALGWSIAAGLRRRRRPSDPAVESVRDIAGG